MSIAKITRIATLTTGVMLAALATPAAAASAPAALAGGPLASAVETRTASEANRTPLVEVRHRRWHGRRGHWRRGYGHRRHRGAGIAAGIAGLVIGAILATGHRARGYRSDWERCDADFRTFRWSDGTYIPYVGSPRVLCPYLR